MLGCVVIEVEIDGVFYEYSIKEGVQEDVIEILLNFKGLVVCFEGKIEVILILVKFGVGFVVVGDIQYDGDVEIINFDYVICILIGEVEISMCIKVEMGCGYVLVFICCFFEEDDCLIGCLLVDVLYSLVECIVYSVEFVCVE